MYENYMNKLFPRKKNQVRNSLYVDKAENMNVFGPFIHCSLKRSSISHSRFIQSQLNYSAWSESFFYDDYFNNCTLNGVNMQLCVFEQTSFKDSEDFNTSLYKNISFCNSLFKNCRFENIIFKNCVLTDATFISCDFVNCKFQSSSFDGTKFIQCNFEGLIARNMNLDYSQFRNCKFNNSQISLFQIAYTIGLLQCIPTASHNWFAFQGRTISAQTFYNEYILYLLEYFRNRGDMFPLSNLQFFMKGTKAQNYIIDGIKEAMCAQKYRLVLHYCELINYYNCISSMEKRELIAFLNNSIRALPEKQNHSEDIKYSVLIEHYLLDKYDNIPHYYISIETDYSVVTGENISSLISELDRILVLEQGEHGEHNITITHNSPLWLDIVLAIGGSIVATYIKEQIIDRLIVKLKVLFKNINVKMKKMTIKAPEDNNSTIVVESEEDNQ